MRRVWGLRSRRGLPYLNIIGATRCSAVPPLRRRCATRCTRSRARIPDSIFKFHHNENNIFFSGRELDAWPHSLIPFPSSSIASTRARSQADMDKLEKKLAHKEGELDMLQIANEALQAQAQVRAIWMESIPFIFSRHTNYIYRHRTMCESRHPTRLLLPSRKKSIYAPQLRDLPHLLRKSTTSEHRRTVQLSLIHI